jgi:hypothetical protein
MPAKLRRSLTLALLTVSLGFAGAAVPASAASFAPAADEPPPTAPDVSKTTCQVSVLFLVQVDPCKIVASLQEVAAYGLEDVAKELGKNALQGVNLINVCARPAHHPTPPPASIVNACPILGG